MSVCRYVCLSSCRSVGIWFGSSLFRCLVLSFVCSFFMSCVRCVCLYICSYLFGCVARSLFSLFSYVVMCFVSY